jgi:hypothetical protein
LALQTCMVMEYYHRSLEDPPEHYLAHFPTTMVPPELAMKAPARGDMTYSELTITGMATNKATMTIAIVLKEKMTTILHPLFFASHTTSWGKIHVLMDVDTPPVPNPFIPECCIQVEKDQVYATLSGLSMYLC